MKKILLVLLAIIGTNSGWCVNVASLYKAQFKVPSQSDALRVKAIKKGLNRVLVKVSGNPDIINNTIIREAIEKPENFVEEFNYTTLKRRDTPYLVHIRYDASGINRLLKKAEVPFWGANRPLILVWLALSRQNKSLEIIGNENPDALLSLMKHKSKKFGLPLIFPVMDIADVSLIMPSDVKEMAVPLLKEAGRRYAANAYLVGYVNETEESVYQSEWELVFNDQIWRFAIAEKADNQLVEHVLNQVSQTFAKNFIVKVTDAPASWLKLQVNNITQHDDLSSLIQYLKQLSLVQKVDLSEISGDQVKLSVQIKGTLLDFTQNASLGDKLILSAQDEKTRTIYYRWIRS